MAIPFTVGEVVTAAELNELARAHWRKVTSNKVVNTTAQTDLLNGEITIGAGAMSTNRCLRLTAWGDALNDTGATQSSINFELQFGTNAPLLIETGAVAGVWASNSSRFPWRVVAEIQNLGSASSQWASLNIDLAGSFFAGDAAFSLGEGIYSLQPTDIGKALGCASGSVNTISAANLYLLATLPVANANLDITLNGALVEVV